MLDRLPQLLTAVFAALLLGVSNFTFTSDASAISGGQFQPGRIMDDHIFFDSSTMTGLNIQHFLESQVSACDTWGTQPFGGTTRADYGTANGNPPPYTCMRDLMINQPAKPADEFCTGSIQPGLRMAAQTIQDIGVACSINPKVLITLLQKEQSLITDDWPWQSQYTAATGFGCPDTASCAPEFAGFFNQVYNAARQYQRYIKQSESFNYRAGRDNFIRFNPNVNCGGSTIFIQNNATAALYNYTPYQPNAAALNNLYGLGDGCSAYGNRNFWRLYADWFGSPTGAFCTLDAVGAAQIDVSFRKQEPRVDNANFVIYNGSSTNCIESHVWNSGFNSWRSHVVSNHPVVTYPDGQVVYADLDGSGREYPILFGLKGTGSGNVEFHLWNQDMQSFIAQRATNMPVVDPANREVVMADLDGDGKDSAILVALSGTGSGMIELHGWLPGSALQEWAFHTVTNNPVVDPTSRTVSFADIDGDGRDEVILVALNNTGSGRIEFHVWNPGQWSWRSHTASNMPTISPDNGKVEFADIDGNGVDEAILVGLNNTGSGRIEFHVWNPGFTSWRSNTASNQPTP